MLQAHSTRHSFQSGTYAEEYVPAASVVVFITIVLVAVLYNTDCCRRTWPSLSCQRRSLLCLWCLRTRAPRTLTFSFFLSLEPQNLNPKLHSGCCLGLGFCLVAARSQSSPRLRRVRASSPRAPRAHVYYISLRCRTRAAGQRRKRSRAHVCYSCPETSSKQSSVPPGRSEPAFTTTV